MITRYGAGSKGTVRLGEKEGEVERMSDSQPLHEGNSLLYHHPLCAHLQFVDECFQLSRREGKTTAEQEVKERDAPARTRRGRRRKPERKKGQRFLSGARDCGSEFQQNVERVDVVLLSTATV